MASQLLSEYFYKLDHRQKIRYQEKIALIRNEDPYALQKAEFCGDVSDLPSLR